MIFMDSLLVLELFHSLIMRLVQSGFQAIVTLLFLALRLTLLQFNNFFFLASRISESSGTVYLRLNKMGMGTMIIETSDRQNRVCVSGFQKLASFSGRSNSMIASKAANMFKILLRH